MYRVLIVDDEYPAIRSVCSIVEKRCDNYTVIDIAQTGEEALTKIRKTLPDLVLCDIKMPVLSGTELVEIICREHPEICFIMISGYQDFEYTQSAIRSGVIDYLLKPIVPSVVQKSLEYAANKIREIQYRQRNSILRTVVNGKNVDMDQLRRYFPAENYYGALLRTNGLPNRFSMEQTREIYSDIVENYVVFGRDEKELLVLIPDVLLSKNDFYAYLDKLCMCQEKESYYTLIYSSSSFSALELAMMVQKMYQELNRRCSIGNTKQIDLAMNDRDISDSVVALWKEGNHILLSLEQLTRTRENRERLSIEIREKYVTLEKYQPSQLWMENFTRQVLEIMRQAGFCTATTFESEQVMSDAFYYATSVSMLVDNLIELFFFGNKAKMENDKVDSPGFFRQIDEWLQVHLDQLITLPDLCRKFGISQTYMSRLFRKYTGNSFNQHLTERRVNRAKELFRENPDYFIKDVASMVGYEDQFYFSRIFKTYTLKSPSEYIKEILKINQK